MRIACVNLHVKSHKFSSCDGCQLAFLNMGEGLLALAQLVEMEHKVFKAIKVRAFKAIKDIKEKAFKATKGIKGFRG